MGGGVDSFSFLFLLFFLSFFLQCVCVSVCVFVFLSANPRRFVCLFFVAVSIVFFCVCLRFSFRESTPIRLPFFRCRLDCFLLCVSSFFFPRIHADSFAFFSLPSRLFSFVC